MIKNTAGQKWIVFAFDVTDGTPKTGDAAQITGKIALDYGAAGGITDTNPTELEDGYYAFDLTQGESNADHLLILPESSTSNIQVIGVPGTVVTVAPNSAELGIEADGDLTKVNLCVNTTLVDTTTTNTDMVGTDSAALASVCTEGRLAELDAANLPADVDTLLTRITSTLFSGITALAEWLGMLAGKQTGNATALTEIKASGAGSGTFDPTTDSEEAIRDRGDAAWPTATGFAVAGDEMTLENDAITAAKIAANAIGASEMADDGSVQIAKAVWDRVLSAALHNIANSAGRRLRDLATSVIITGTSPDTGGTANTAIRIELDGDASAMDGAYDPANINIVGGTGVGQSRQIFEYDGTNKYAYISRDWKVIPDSTSEYAILSNSGNTHVNEGLATGGSSTSITLNSLASAVNGTYVGQVVFIFAGTGQDQARRITAYNGTTKVATVETWQTDPDNGSIYAILPLQANDLSAADVNAEVVDVMTVDTIAELSQGIPVTNPTFATAIMLLYMMERNNRTTVAAELGIYNDAGTKIAKKVLSDDTTTYTEDKMASGA